MLSREFTRLRKVHSKMLKSEDIINTISPPMMASIWHMFTDDISVSRPRRQNNWSDDEMYLAMKNAVEHSGYYIVVYGGRMRKCSAVKYNEYFSTLDEE